MLAETLPTGAELADSRTQPTSRPKIGLVLSGGGARGAAHIGVIKRLEELNIPIDVISGTSMGAIIGGIYAAGVPIEDIESWVENADWRSLFSDQPKRAQRSMRSKEEDFNYPRGQEIGLHGLKLKSRPSLVAGQKFILELRKLTMPAIDITDFDKLPIPFRAVATDILTGDSVVLDSGSLPEALRASMAIPGLFAPVKRDGKVLVDGFLSNNLPVDIAQQMGADIVIAVNVSAELLKEGELNTPFAYSAQMISILTQTQERRQRERLGDEDVYIHVLMPNQKSGDFASTVENIAPGYVAAQEQDTQLANLGVSKSEYTAWNTQRQQIELHPIVIDKVQVAGTSKTSSQAIQKRLGIRAGDHLSIPKLERGLNRIYDLRTFELVDFSLRPTGDSDRRILELDPQDKSWGPNYLKFGVNLSSDLESESSFNLKLNYRMTQLNSLGGEFEAEAIVGQGQLYETTFYQPLDSHGRFFVEPSVQYFRQRVSDQSNVSVRGYNYSFTTGVNFGSHAVLGATIASSDNNIRGIAPDTLKLTRDSLTIDLAWDTLDNPYFPKSGLSFDLAVSDSRSELKGLLTDLDSQTYLAEIIWPVTRGRSTLLTTLSAGGLIDPEHNSSVLSPYSLGGLFSLSGMPEDSLEGDSLFLSRFIYYYHLSEFAPMLGEGVYVGASLETGNAWDKGDSGINGLILAGSVFVGVDTFLGPLYLAYGRADKKEASSLYFYLGQNF